MLKTGVVHQQDEQGGNSRESSRFVPFNSIKYGIRVRHRNSNQTAAAYEIESYSSHKTKDMAYRNNGQCSYIPGFHGSVIVGYPLAYANRFGHDVVIG